MAKGFKTGGRRKGSVNKKTAELQSAVAESGITPLEFLLTQMRSEGNEISLRIESAKAAAPYVHPKLANVELSGDQDNPVKTVMEIIWAGSSDSGS